MITPYLRFCKTTVAETAAAIHGAAMDARKVWISQLCRFVPTDILRVLIELTHDAACRRIEDAEYLTASGFQSVLITLPVVNRDSLSRLRSLISQAQFTVVIDHFVHAELLSQVAVSAGGTIGVLLDVDLGLQMTGIRPGPDSVLLASALTRLPGIFLRGVYVDDRGDDESSTGESTALSFEQSIGVAIHCQRIIQESGIACSEIVSGLSMLNEAIAHPAVTAILANPLSAKLASPNTFSEVPDRHHRPAVELVCSVISRPSLECCVIDAGQCNWGDSKHLQIIDPSGASLLRALPEIAVLSLSGASLDLRIGDEVTLVHPRLTAN